ncbi:MAG: porin [Rubrivivax sp.]|nr:porin [Rubrivivax sp.]
MREPRIAIALQAAPTFVALSAATLLLAIAATPARAFEYKLSGHVNRLLVQVDDGTQNRLFHADNVNSQTRFRFTGTHEVQPGLRAGINWEVGYTSNPSSSISMTTRSVDATFNERHAEVFLLGPWGKASFGQGDGAANGGMEVDLSGTTVINYSGVTDIGAGFALRSGAVVGPTIGATIGNLDFESRYDRIRYDTPKWGPLSAAVSFGTKGNNDVHEAAVSADSPLAGGRVAATLGFSRERRGGASGNEDTLGGSLSWRAANGFNVTLALGVSEDDNPALVRKEFGYLKLGYIVGNHAVSVDVGRGQDFALAGDRADVVGVGYNYTAAKWLDLYAGAKQHKLDRAGTAFDAVNFVMAGMRLKF